MYWGLAFHPAGGHGQPELYGRGGGAVADEMVGHVDVSEGTVTMQPEQCVQSRHEHWPY